MHLLPSWRRIEALLQHTGISLLFLASSILLTPLKSSKSHLNVYMEWRLLQSTWLKIRRRFDFASPQQNPLDVEQSPTSRSLVLCSSEQKIRWETFDKGDAFVSTWAANQEAFRPWFCVRSLAKGPSGATRRPGLVLALARPMLTGGAS